jgi:hypothetical protein
VAHDERGKAGVVGRGSGGEAVVGLGRGSHAGPEGRRPAQQGEESLFFISFFPINLNHIFEQPKTIFRIWGKNKSCLEI